MHAVHLTKYGDPMAGLTHVEIPEPRPPGAGEVIVSVAFAPVDYSDFLMAKGVYVTKPALPVVIGNEGAGVVTSVGAGVTIVKLGDRVLLPTGVPTWAQRIVVSAEKLFALPSNIELQQASMLTINPPAASLLLSAFVKLKPGDWVLQNAGNSGVGRAVIAMAKAKGIRTASIVRRPELVAELVATGADLVVVESAAALGELRAGIDGGHVALGIDGVGGDAMATLSAVVSAGASLVNYSMLGGDRVSLPASLLTFKRLKVSGFFMYHAEHKEALPRAVLEGVALMAAGKLRFPVAAVYPIRDIKQAVEHAVRGGKVLLDMAD